MEKRLERLLVFLTAVLILAGCFIRRPEPAVVTITPAPITPAPIAAPVPSESASPSAVPSSASKTETIPEETKCDDKACVALYIHTWKHLPSNYMTKKEARKIGWKRGPLSKVKKGMSIGGDIYGNYEGNLPDDYVYRECDLNTNGKKKRKTERLVYSEGGEYVYYTDDHYQTFELLYGED